MLPEAAEGHEITRYCYFVCADLRHHLALSCYWLQSEVGQELAVEDALVKWAGDEVVAHRAGVSFVHKI